MKSIYHPTNHHWTRECDGEYNNTRKKKTIENDKLSMSMVLIWLISTFNRFLSASFIWLIDCWMFFSKKKILKLYPPIFFRSTMRINHQIVNHHQYQQQSFDLSESISNSKWIMSFEFFSSNSNVNQCTSFVYDQFVVVVFICPVLFVWFFSKIFLKNSKRSSSQVWKKWWNEKEKKKSLFLFFV